MTDPTIPDETADRLAIHELLARYARGVDSRDWDLFADCFTDAAVVDYSSAGGPAGTAREVSPWLDESFQTWTVSAHHVTNIEIDLDGDTGSGRALFYSPMGKPADGGQLDVLHVGGRYTDTYERTAAGWKLAGRLQEATWWSGSWSPPQD